MNNNIDNNPWVGLASYQDPATADRQLLFCGRRSESLELTALIDDNIFVTLYGKSGIGKTSLLNAGVFPELRRQSYVPVSIRLGMDAVGMSFQKSIVSKVEQACRVEHVEVIEPCKDENDTVWLWNWFARSRFYLGEVAVFPVVVFDQMEEVFRSRRDEAEVLLRQIHYMVDENHALPPRVLADGSRYEYDFNFRFVATLREDDLYRLEDSLDRCFLPAMKRCRYRLHAMNYQSASDVVMKPGKDVIEPKDATKITDTIIQMARSTQDDTISTNLLSLLCSRLYAEKERRHESLITLQMLGEFMQKNPIVMFYNEATKPLRGREKTWIEEHLVDSAGRRNSVSESDFRLHVRDTDRLLEGKNKILQRTSVGSNAQDYRIELIHDSFCEPLVGLKTQRRNRRMFRYFLSGVLVLVAVALGVYLYWLKLDEALYDTKVARARIIAEKAQILIDEGDAVSAQWLVLNALPRNLSDYSGEGIYIPELEAALRRALQDGSVTMRGHEGGVNNASFSPDGSRVVSASNDSTVRLWDAYSGAQLKVFKGHKGNVYTASFNPRGNRIVSVDDSNAYVWDTAGGKPLAVLSGAQYAAIFVSDDHTVATLDSNYVVTIWNIKNGQPIKSIKAPDRISFPGDAFPKFRVCPTRDTLFLVSKIKPAVAADDENEDEKDMCCVIRYDLKTNKLEKLLIFGGRKRCDVVFANKGRKDRLYGTFVLTSDTKNAKIEVRDINGNIVNRKKSPWDKMAHPVVFNSVVDETSNMALHPNGETFAFANSMGSISLLWHIIWANTDVVKPLRKGSGYQISLNPETGEIRGIGNGGVDFSSLEFSPDGTRLLVGRQDATIRCWRIYRDTSDLSVTRFQSAYRIKDSDTNGVVCESDNNRFRLVGGKDSTLMDGSRLRDDTVCYWYNENTCFDTFCIDRVRNLLAWVSTDSAIRVSAYRNGCISIENNNMNLVNIQASYPIGSLILNSQKNRLAFYEILGNSVKVIDVNTGTQVVSFDHVDISADCIGINKIGDKIILIDVDKDWWDDGKKDYANIEIISYPHLQTLIDEGWERFKGRQLSEEEKALFQKGGWKNHRRNGEYRPR